MIDPTAPEFAMAGRFIPGTGWFAKVQTDLSRPQHNNKFEESYAAIIGWELYTDEKGESAVRAWITGHPPVASDKFWDQTGWLIGSYEHFTPEEVSKKKETGEAMNWAWC